MTRHTTVSTCVLCSKGPLQLFSWGSVHHSWVTEAGRCDRAAPAQGWPPRGVNCPPCRTGAGGRAGWASGSFSWAPRARPEPRWAGRPGKGSERLSPGGGWWLLHLSGRTGSLATESWTTGARRLPTLAPDEAERDGHVGKNFTDLHRFHCCLHVKVQSKRTSPSLLAFRGQRHRQGAAFNYLFSQVTSVAQVQPDHLDHCEEDHPSNEQTLVVSLKIMELENKYMLTEVKRGDQRLHFKSGFNYVLVQSSLKALLFNRRFHLH